ncbi:MAG: hypothetical protein R3B84_01675 [Zavarzinella sp.]
MFVSPPPMYPFLIDEVTVLQKQAIYLQNLAVLQAQQEMQARAMVTGGMFSNYANLNDFDPEVLATQLLMMRKCREAILESPNHPDSYAMLATVYGLSTLEEGLKTQVANASLARYIYRLPPSPIKGRISAYATTVTRRMFEFYLQMGAGDLAQDALTQCINYSEEELQRFQDISAADGISEEEEKQLSELKQNMDLLNQMSSKLQQQLNQQLAAYESEIPAAKDPLEKIGIAKRYGLYLVAKTHLDEIDFSQPDPLIYTYLAERVDIAIMTGDLETAYEVLQQLNNQNFQREFVNQAAINAFGNARVRLFQVQFPDPKNAPRVDQSKFDLRSVFERHQRVVALAFGDFEQISTIFERDLQENARQQAEIETQYPFVAMTVPEVETTQPYLAIRAMAMSLNPYEIMINNIWAFHFEMRQFYISSLRSRAVAQMTLAQIRLEQGEITKAITALRTIENMPDRPEIASYRRNAKKLADFITTTRK